LWYFKWLGLDCVWIMVACIYNMNHQIFSQYISATHAGALSIIFLFIQSLALFTTRYISELLYNKFITATFNHANYNLSKLLTKKSHFYLYSLDLQTNGTFDLSIKVIWEITVTAEFRVERSRAIVWVEDKSKHSAAESKKVVRLRKYCGTLFCSQYMRGLLHRLSLHIR